jgi:hypothetical protein
LNIAVVAIAGSMSGTTTWKNIRNSLAPSILAASINSAGMVRMKPLIIKMVMGNAHPI